MHYFLDDLVPHDDDDPTLAKTEYARWLFAHGIVPTAGQIYGMLWSTVHADPFSRRVLACTDTLVNVWPHALVSQPWSIAKVLGNLIAHGQWDTVDRMVERLSRALQHVMLHVTTFESRTDAGAADVRCRCCCCCDLPGGVRIDSDTLWPIDDDRWDTHSGNNSSRSLWNDFSKNTIMIHAVPVDRQGMTVYSRDFMRARTLLDLAERCDPVLNPTTAKAWRSWCGSPVPYHGRHMYDVLAALSDRGLLV